MTNVLYRGYRITYEAPPIPIRAFDYEHENFDGLDDNRYGHAASVEACKAAIDEALDE